MTPRETDTMDHHVSFGTRTLPPHTSGDWDRIEYQRLWLRMETRAWRTLAVVPGEDWMPTHEVANTIMSIGVHHGASIGVFDLRNIALNRVLGVIQAACSQLRRGERVIFATRAIQNNLAAIPLARACEGVVLCAALGSTPIKTLEETIEQIGRDHFLGCVLLRQAQDRIPLSRRLEAKAS